MTARSAAGADDMTACLLDPHDAAGTGTVTEELEIDSAADPRSLEGFLERCGLAPDQVKEGVEQTALQAAFGTPVILRVHRHPDGADWDLVPVDADAEPPLVGALAKLPVP